MLKLDSTWFDLKKIMDSGQCFRIYPQTDGSIVAISEDNFVVATLSEDGFWELDCTDNKEKTYWENYFDAKTDYKTWFESIDPSDEYLMHAKVVGQGLRVINQDPWETLISFIISQRRSVASITSCIEKLCAKYGERIDTSGHNVEKPIFTFPQPEQLAGLSVLDLIDCSMGYRTEYVIDAAQRVVSGDINLEALTQVDDQTLLEQLMTIKGVGIKVANCTALYGFRRLGLFPIDVWIKRVLDEHYPDGFPSENYPGYAGFLQLLMFYEARH